MNHLGLICLITVFLMSCAGPQNPTVEEEPEISEEDMEESDFSNRARDVITYSREEAIRLGHDYIGSEHLLLGIIREREGLAVKILRHLGCDRLRLKEVIEDTVRGSGGRLTEGNLPRTRQAQEILQNAYLEARLYKSDVVGTEHLLLSLLKTKGHIAAEILQHGFSITYDKARSALDDLITDK